MTSNPSHDHDGLRVRLGLAGLGVTVTVGARAGDSDGKPEETQECLPMVMLRETLLSVP